MIKLLLILIGLIIPIAFLVLVGVSNPIIGVILIIWFIGVVISAIKKNKQ